MELSMRLGIRLRPGKSAFGFSISFMEQTGLIAAIHLGLQRRMSNRDARAFWTFFHARSRCQRQSRHHRAISEYRRKRVGPSFHAGRKRHHWYYGLVRTGIPSIMQRGSNSPVPYVNTNSVPPSVGGFHLNSHNKIHFFVVDRRA